MRNYVTINGVDSTSLAGFLIQELPPLSLPKMRTKTETIDGRDGDIITKLGYSAYDKEITIGLYGSYDIDKINEFFVSEGTIVFSNEPDKYYLFTMVDGIDYDRLVRFRTGKITFHCQPFKYDATETEIDFTNTFTEDIVPYIFRANTHDANMMKLKKVVGGTIAWNQIAQKGDGIVNASTKSYDSTTGITTITPQYTSNNSGVYNLVPTAKLQTHKYYVSVRIDTDNSGGFRFGFGTSAPVVQVSSGGYSRVEGVFLWSASSLTLYAKALESGWTSGTYRFKDVMCIDLTLMFGSTIADYIYSLEQAHAGDGVAWFKALFGEDYYPYNSGELMSVKTSAHKTVGFNQFDKSKATHGYKILGNGQLYPDSNYAISDYIRTVSNSVYYVSPNWSVGLNVIFFYDSDKVLIDKMANNTHLYTTPSNCAYVRINMTEEEVDTACINLSSSRNGEYEPYEEHTYPLDGNLTLRGIPKLDADHNLYYDGDTYASDGNVQRKYGTVTFNGSETWYYDSNNALAYTIVTNGIIISGQTQYNVYVANDNASLMSESWAGRSNADGTMGMYYGQTRIFVKKSTITSNSDAKTYFTNNPTNVIYALETPTTESADAYTQSQRVGATEEFVDGRTVEIPVGNNTLYYDGTPEITVKNKGNTTSRPTLTIYGEGTITVSLNGDEIFTITMGDHEYITIDTEEMNAYMGGVLLNRSVTGDYSSFVLNAGDNTISLSGNVSEVLIDNYSRWL